MQTRHARTTIACRDLFLLGGFYESVFGWLRAPATHGGDMEFELPGGSRIAFTAADGLANRTGEPVLAVGGLHPVVLRLELVDIEDVEARFLDGGGRLLSARVTREDGVESSLLADPEGNVVELARVVARKPRGHYTRDEFVRRVADLIQRSGVEDAETLVRDLESAVVFPLLDRCGATSSLYQGARCVLLPGHQGYCEGAYGERWMRMGSGS